MTFGCEVETKWHMASPFDRNNPIQITAAHSKQASPAFHRYYQGQSTIYFTLLIF